MNLDFIFAFFLWPAALFAALLLYGVFAIRRSEAGRRHHDGHQLHPGE